MPAQGVFVEDDRPFLDHLEGPVLGHLVARLALAPGRRGAGQLAVAGQRIVVFPIADRVGLVVGSDDLLGHGVHRAGVHAGGHDMPDSAWPRAAREKLKAAMWMSSL